MMTRMACRALAVNLAAMQSLMTSQSGLAPAVVFLALALTACAAPEPSVPEDPAADGTTPGATARLVQHHIPNSSQTSLQTAFYTVDSREQFV